MLTRARMKPTPLLLLPLLCVFAFTARAQVPDGPNEIYGGGAFTQTQYTLRPSQTGGGLGLRAHASLIDLVITRGFKQTFRFRGGDYIGLEGAYGIKGGTKIDSISTDRGKYWYIRNLELGVQGFYAISRHVDLGVRGYRMWLRDETRLNNAGQGAQQEFTVLKLVARVHKLGLEGGFALPETNPVENATGKTRYLTLSLRYLWFDDYFFGGRYDLIRSDAETTAGAPDIPLPGTGYESQSYRVFFGRYF